MRVLLVEPDYRRTKANSRSKTQERQSDATLWYPPLALLKIAHFHKDRGDKVEFVCGCDPHSFSPGDLFSPGRLFDRIYITTLFTFDFDKIVKTINFYKQATGGTSGKIYIGGIMASIMPDDIFEETGIYPITGLLTSPKAIGLSGQVNIDRLFPDYSILDPSVYAINSTFYGYTTRGCPNGCAWCGVPTIEPEYIPYIDVKPMIRKMRKQYGDYSTLKLMDNNVLASPKLDKIVEDLIALGYGRNKYTKTQPPKQRVIDFNQGLDATHLNKSNMALLSKLSIKPMRIAFDRIGEKRDYIRALNLAHNAGVPEISNYMLYNFRDTPSDLYQRLVTNIELNEKWIAESGNGIPGKIYCYPMRFAPIFDSDKQHLNRSRDFFVETSNRKSNWLTSPNWTPRFVRNIEVMKGAAHGAISATPSLAWRTIGRSFEEFLANLYMPEELLRNRNKHEKFVHEHEPNRKPGSGKVEAFREFITGLLKKQGEKFNFFHEAVTPNRAATIYNALESTRDRETKKWLTLYLRR